MEIFIYNNEGPNFFEEREVNYYKKCIESYIDSFKCVPAIGQTIFPSYEVDGGIIKDIYFNDLKIGFFISKQ